MRWQRDGVGAVESLSFETSVLSLPALGYLLVLELQGAGPAPTSVQPSEPKHTR